MTTKTPKIIGKFSSLKNKSATCLKRIYFHSRPKPIQQEAQEHNRHRKREAGSGY
jgi:hypothetical protein